MRFLEVLLLAGIIAHLLAGLVGRAPRGGLRHLPPLLGVLTVAQVLAEGARAPMAPAYFYVVATLAWWLGGERRKRAPAAPRRTWVALLAGAAGVAIGALVLAPPVLLPVMRLPVPTGPYGVGTSWLFVVDSTRHEPLGPDSTAFREIAVKAWYPADSGASGPRAPYATANEVDIAGQGLPRAYRAQFRLVRTHAMMDAPPARAPAPFPTLVFSHGYTGFAAQNTVQMEELASHGYAVFSVVHAYESAAMPRPDGSEVLLRKELFQAMQRSGSKFFQAILASGAEIEGAKDAEGRQAAFKRLIEIYPPNIQHNVAIWAADTRAVVDRLERENAGSGRPASRFAGRLDLGRLGVFGMSYGGATTGEFCRLDRRCKAGLNLDGANFGGLIDDSLVIPFLTLSSESAGPIYRPIVDRLRGPAYLIVVTGTTHLGLTDYSLFAPQLFRWLGVTGRMAPGRREEIMSAYVSAFFDRYLKGERSALLDGPSPKYPDVRFAFARP